METKPAPRRNIAEGAAEGNRKALSRREHELQDVALILASPTGRRFFYRYLEVCHVFKTSFDNSGSVTAFNEGERNVGLRLFRDINDASPESYSVMLKEAKENENV